MIPPCLKLGNIRYISRVKWSNSGKGVVPSPELWCSSYWKGSLLVVLFTYLFAYNDRFLKIMSDFTCKSLIKTSHYFPNALMPSHQPFFLSVHCRTLAYLKFCKIWEVMSLILCCTMIFWFGVWINRTD